MINKVNYNSNLSSHFLLKLFLPFAFLLIFLPSISAAEIQLQTSDSSFDQGETLLAVVSGNFIDQPTASNILFYRGHVKIPMDFKIEKINDDFYIAAFLIDKTAGNYSLNVSGVDYRQGTSVVSDPIIQNFTITENTSAFSINPGFANVNGSFSVELQNLRGNQIALQLKTSPNLNSTSGNSINIKSGEIKELTFDLLQNSTGGDSGNISFTSGNSSYSFPVFFSENLTANNSEGKKPEFKFEPQTIDVSMATSSDSKRIIYLINTGDVDLEDITFFIPENLLPYVEINPESSKLSANKTGKIEISITSDSTEKIVEGKITATAKNVSSSTTLVLNFVKDYVPPAGENSTTSIVTTCSQLSGSICAEGKQCSSSDSIQAKDGVCCLAECNVVEKSSKGKIIGWGIVVLIILFLFWFYKRRYRRVGNPR